MKKLSAKLRSRLAAMTAVEALYAGIYLAQRASSDFMDGFELAATGDDDDHIVGYINGGQGVIEQPIGFELAAAGRVLNDERAEEIRNMIEDFIKERKR